MLNTNLLEQILAGQLQFMMKNIKDQVKLPEQLRMKNIVQRLSTITNLSISLTTWLHCIENRKKTHKLTFHIINAECVRLPLNP